MMKFKILLLLLFVLLQVNSFSQTISLDSILTPHEISWLNQNKDKIRYAPDTSWPPREFIDEEGNHKGIVADYIRIIEERLGVTFERVYYESWAEVMEALRSEEIDIVGGIHKSPKREEYLNITDPFIESPVGIVVKDKNLELLSKKNIDSMTLAFPKSFASIDYIKQTYPGAEIVEFKNNFSTLLEVTFGEVDGAVIDLMTASYLVNKHGIQNLHLMKTLDYEWQIGIGVIESQPELYSIIEKTLNSISQAERKAIYKKWTNIKFLHTQNFFERYQHVFIILLVFVSVLCLLVFFINLALRKMVAERTGELNLAMDELAKKEEKYRVLVENQTDLIIKLDLQGRFQFVSPSYCNLFGKSEDELLGQHFHPMVYEEDIPATLEAIEATCNPPHIVWVEHRANTASGMRWIEWTGRAFFSEANEVVGIIAIGRDINEKKAFEIDLINAKELAEESDRLKSAFLANISHEIRTPMNSIMGFASLLPQEEDKKLIDNYAGIILSNSELLVHIIDDIVLYSRLQSRSYKYEPRTFNVCDLFEEIKQSFNLPEYQQGVELLTENMMDCPQTIKTDYEKLKQIIINLIGNAFKYTPSGSITLGGESSEGDAVFYVKDTGIGIHKGETEKIFHRFFRGSNTRKETIPGTGLGLSIVKELVTLLGADIWVESEDGKGSVFYVRLRSKR